MLRLRSRHKIVEIKTLRFVEKSCRDKEKISTMSRQNLANLGIFSSLSRFSQMSGFRHLDIYVEIVSRLCMSRFTILKRISLLFFRIPAESNFLFFFVWLKKEKYYQKKRNFYNILFSFSSPKYVLCRTEYEGERKEKPNLLKETFFFGNSHD